MSQYSEVWKFTRERLAQAYQDLSPDQLCWRPFDGGHNIGEMLYHIAGVEVWFSTKMTGVPTDGELSKLASAARDAYITDAPAPYVDSDMTVEAIDRVLKISGELMGPVISNPSDGQLTMDIETVIGPIVPGAACLWRVAQHSAYHTGQMWTYRQNPNFPS